MAHIAGRMQKTKSQVKCKKPSKPTFCVVLTSSTPPIGFSYKTRVSSKLFSVPEIVLLFRFLKLHRDLEKKQRMECSFFAVHVPKLSKSLQGGACTCARTFFFLKKKTTSSVWHRQLRMELRDQARGAGIQAGGGSG